MAKQSINTIKNWFRTGLKPTQQQFWDWLDSYRHKDDDVLAADIDGLQELLDAKVDKKDFVEPEIYDPLKNYVYDVENQQYVSFSNSGSADPQFQNEGFYRLIEDATAGENPETNPEHWVYQGQTIGDIAIEDVIGLIEVLNGQEADFIELKDISDYADSPMIISGGEISLGTNAGTYKINAITSLLRKTDSLTGELTYITLPEQDNQTITNADTIYYVSLNYNEGTPTTSVSLNPPYGTDKRNIPIGKVMKDSNNNIHYISGGYNFQDGVRKLHARAVELRSLELESGSTIAYSGTNNFTMIEGAVYGGINRYGLSSYDSAITTFVPIYQDGSDGWIEGTPRNTIDYSHYDNGSGTLAIINNNKFSCHWVYKHIDDNDVYVVYGRDSYTLAEAELSTEPNRPTHLSTFGCLLGRIIAPKSGGSFASIHMVTDNFFVGTSVSNHNQLGNLQGGILNEYYHLSNNQWVKATQIATTTQDGLMASALVNDITANNEAIHKDVTSEISTITEKTTLADDDLFIIEDSENGNIKKKVKKSNINGHIDFIEGGNPYTIYTIDQVINGGNVNGN